MQTAVASYLKVFGSMANNVAGFISPTPLLVIGGTKSDSKHFQQETYDAAEEPKELFWIDGATHNDLYDVEKATQPVADKMAEVLRST